MICCLNAPLFSESLIFTLLTFTELCVEVENINLLGRVYEAKSEINFHFMTHSACILIIYLWLFRGNFALFRNASPKASSHYGHYVYASVPCFIAFHIHVDIFILSVLLFRAQFDVRLARSLRTMNYGDVHSPRAFLLLATIMLSFLSKLF